MYISTEKPKRRLTREEIKAALKDYGIKPKLQTEDAVVEDFSDDVYRFMEDALDRSNASNGVEMMAVAEALTPTHCEVFEVYRLVEDAENLWRIRFPCYAVPEIVMDKPETAEGSEQLLLTLKDTFMSIHKFYIDNDLEIPPSVLRHDVTAPRAVEFDQGYQLRLFLYNENIPKHKRRNHDSRGIPVCH